MRSTMLVKSHRIVHATPAALLIVLAACRPETAPRSIAEPALAADSTIATYNDVPALGSFGPDEALLGGATTVFRTDDEAFEQPAANLDAAGLAQHDAGDDAFGKVFVASTGLGPQFNNPACDGCHVLDGRGVLPAPGQPLESMLLRLSVQGTAGDGGPLGAPGFGGQLQTRGVPPVPAEASVDITLDVTRGRYGDGTPFELRRPRFALRNPHRPLPPGLLISPRVAPPVIGLGLLEAVPVATLERLADPNDRDGDGISGRINVVFDARNGLPGVGRFGVKANTASLFQQTAGAYNGDMGITTSLFPAENCEGNYPQCARKPAEVTDSVLRVNTFYSQTLAVPARRDLNDLTARLGQALFLVTGCASCHTTQLQTGTLAGVPAVSNQTIRPFTDLLIHDMGEGLADDRPDFRASGREWRTAPLWGIGLTKVINPDATFLHDGRARTLAEAILWHGGEAQRSREIFRLLPAHLRGAMLRFLETL
ncbi:MAG: hypothetical protein MUF00_05675 [Gemmatimonadaceae bacterium]|jgi:CxxC motif-containing protein (DUF1111 family)|nr:hypothetical protein [Gemmatimonadaceae bacterium]